MVTILSQESENQRYLHTSHDHELRVLLQVSSETTHGEELLHFRCQFQRLRQLWLTLEPMAQESRGLRTNPPPRLGSIVVFAQVCVCVCQPASLWNELSFGARALCSRTSSWNVLFSCVFVSSSQNKCDNCPITNALGSRPGAPWGGLGAQNAPRLKTLLQIYFIASPCWTMFETLSEGTLEKTVSRLSFVDFLFVLVACCWQMVETVICVTYLM